MARKRKTAVHIQLVGTTLRISPLAPSERGRHEPDLRASSAVHYPPDWFALTRFG